MVDKSSWRALPRAALATFVGLLVLELVATGYYAIVDPSVDPRSEADVYADADWSRDYFEGLAQSHVQWQPYVYWRRAPFESPHINVDGRGLRKTWQQPAGEGRRPTVLMFGGSAVWGTGARDDFSIPSLVAKRLAEAGTPARVVNWGESGYVSTQELIALQLALRDGARPDVVVFYDGANDIVAAAQLGEAGAPQNESNRTAEFNLRHPRRLWAAISTTIRSVLLRLSLVRAIRSAAAAIRGGNEATPPDGTPVRDAVQAHHANMSIAGALGQSYGFSCLSYWQPTVFDKKTRSTYEEQERAKQRPLEPLFAEASVVRHALATNTTSPTVRDLGPVVAGLETPLFIDWVHTAEDGNRLVAEVIGNDILDLLAHTRTAE